jgi:hypothetical protein
VEERSSGALPQNLLPFFFSLCSDNEMCGQGWQLSLELPNWYRGKGREGKRSEYWMK